MTESQVATRPEPGEPRMGQEIGANGNVSGPNRWGACRMELTVRGDVHRAYFRQPDGTVDCSCGEDACPAQQALLAQHQTRTPAVASDRDSDLAIYYCLEPELTCELRVASAATDPGTVIDPRAALATPVPRFVAAADCELLRDALGDGPALSIRGNLDWIVRLLATHRARYNGARLTLGEPCTATLRWRMTLDGAQQLVVDPPEGQRLFCHDPILFLDPERNTLAPLAIDDQPVTTALSRDALPLSLAATALNDPRWSGWGDLIPAPFVPERIEDRCVDPIATLTARPDGVEAELRYGGAKLTWPLPDGDLLYDTTNPVVGRIPRALSVEKRLQDALTDAGVAGNERDPLRIARALTEEQERLRAAGWTLVDRASRELTVGDEGGLTLGLANDQATLRLDGRKLALDGRRLVGKRYVYLETRARSVIVVARSLFEDVVAALNSEREQLPARAAALPLKIEDAPELAGRLEALRQPAEYVLPDMIHAAVRPYQLAGFRWLQSLFDAGFGSILADDMGLGKTLQSLAHICAVTSRPQSAPALVVAPASVAGNWLREARRFAPRLKTALYHGPKRRRSWLGRRSLIITTYALLRQDIEPLAAQPWSLVILDEAQAIKNARSGTARAARQLSAQQRIAVSGTPMENHLGELWSIMRFAEPGLLGGRSAFEREFQAPIEQRRSVDCRRRLVRRIAPFILRRTRQEVLNELPACTEHEIMVGLSEAEQALYESVRASSLTELQSDTDLDPFGRRARALSILTRLRQICCASWLLPAAFPGRLPGSAKLDRCVEMLRQLVAGGHKALVFSQFRSLLELLAARLDDTSIRYRMLTGLTRDRAAVVDEFQSGLADAFLVSLRAGGSGLNLTQADTVILLDPWWNPAIEDQAIARAHRMGQTRPVFVYRLIAQDTVEEEIQVLKSSKRDLADALGSDLSTLDPTDPDILKRLLS